jgi:large subunit ribosomal protein L23
MATDLKAKYANIILRPRITEKASTISASNVYTFEVGKNSTKGQIAQAIKIYYKVTPVKVRTVVNPTKQVFVRGKKGTKPAVKKAYVYLKKGDKLE